MKWNWRAATAAFWLFAGVSLYGVVNGHATCASCFGAYHISPYYSLAIDLAALGALLLFPPPNRDPQEPAGDQQRRRDRLSAALLTAGGAVALIAVAIVLAGFRPSVLGMSHGPLPTRSRVILLRPSEWIGRSCPVLPHIQSDVELHKGTWIVVFKRAGCAACDVVLPECEQLAVEAAGQADEMHLAIIDVGGGERGNGESSPEPTPRSPPTLGHLDPSRSWHVRVPAVVLLSDGVVEFAVEGAVRGFGGAIRGLAAWKRAMLEDRPSAYGGGSDADGVEDASLPPDRDPMFRRAQGPSP